MQFAPTETWEMMILVGGIGWISRKGYGCVKKSLRIDSGEAPAVPQRQEVFLHPFDNFGRLDPISKMTAYAVALALKDAGISYPLGRKQDIGIIGTNSGGCIDSDIRYFKDYLDSGRTLSRGNLFIYTLPSSPLSEAAIHFGLQGPLFYTSGTGMAETLNMAAEIIHTDEAAIMLAGMAEEGAAAYFVLSKGDCFPDGNLGEVSQNVVTRFIGCV